MDAAMKTVLYLKGFRAKGSKDLLLQLAEAPLLLLFSNSRRHRLFGFCCDRDYSASKSLGNWSYSWPPNEYLHRFRSAYIHYTCHLLCIEAGVTITFIAWCSVSAAVLFNFSGQTVQLRRRGCSVLSDDTVQLVRPRCLTLSAVFIWMLTTKPI